MKVACLIGTRPEAIKMAPVVRALKEQSAYVEVCVVATAQHRSLLDDVLSVFAIKPDYDLDVMRPNQTLSGVASAIFSGLDAVLDVADPDWILVQGDTVTSMAASLAAFYHRIRIGHIEAGLRTHDRWQPYPEEVHRRITSLVADLHFAPTEAARRNLLREGIPPTSVFVTGNTVVDALRWIGGRSDTATCGADLLPRRDGVRTVLLTAHRRENFGAGLTEICEAVRRICSRYGEAVHFICPVHPNPNAHDALRRHLADLPQVTLTPPLSYPSIVKVMAHSFLIMTDSGGLQEEACSLGKPILVLRDVTERMEIVEAGAARTIGSNADGIERTFRELWENGDVYGRMARVRTLFGDGNAAQRIVSILIDERIAPRMEDRTYVV